MQSFKQFLNKKTLEPKQIAKHHNVDVDLIKRQMKMGIGVEQEHTTSKTIARKIALDHLREDPRYYSKLLKMEKKKK